MCISSSSRFFFFFRCLEENVSYLFFSLLKNAPLSNSTDERALTRTVALKDEKIKKGVFTSLLSRAAHYTANCYIYKSYPSFYKYLYRLLYVARKYIISSRVETRTLRLPRDEFATKFAPSSLSWSLFFIYFTRI